MGQCRLKVSNVTVQSTGSRNFDIEFIWDEGVWKQEFRDCAELTGAIPLNEELQTSIEAQYIFEGKNVYDGAFNLTEDVSVSAESEVYQSLRRVINKVRWEDKSCESAISIIQKELSVPLVLAHSKIFAEESHDGPLALPEDGILDKEKSSIDLFCLLNLDADDMPVGEIIKYMTDQLDLRYQIGAEEIFLSGHIKSPLNLIRVSDGFMEGFQEYLLDPESSEEGILDTPAESSLSGYLRRFGISNSKLLHSFTAEKFIYFRGRAPMEIFEAQVGGGVEIFEILFSNEKSFNEFKTRSENLEFSQVISEFIKNRKILLAKNMFMLSSDGSLANRMGALEIKNEQVSYESKMSDIKAEFTTKTFKFSKLIEADGKVRVVCEPPFLLHEDIRRYETIELSENKKSSFNFKELTLEESVLKIRKGFKTPIILRTHLSSDVPAPALVGDSADDPFGDPADDPFGDDPFGDPAEEHSSDSPEVDPKFSLNIQNLNLYEISSVLAYVTSHKVLVDTHAVIISSPRIFICGGLTTRFFRMKRSTLDRLGWKEEPSTNSDLIGNIDKSESEETYENGFMEIVNWEAGSQLAYLPGVERMVVTLSTYEFPVLKAVLNILNKTTFSSLKLKGEPIEVSEGMEMGKGNHFVKNFGEGLIAGNNQLTVKFNQNTLLREFTRSGAGLFRNARSLKEVKTAAKKYILPEFSVDSDNLSEILYTLSNKSQKLQLPDIYVNLIVRLDELQGKRKVLQKVFKNIEILDLLEAIAQHFELKLIFSKNLTVFTDCTSDYYPDEIILFTLKNPLKEKRELIKLLSPQIRHLVSKTITEEEAVSDPFVEGMDLNHFFLRPNVKLLKGGSQVILHGKSPLVRAIENDLRKKNYLAVNTSLKFTIEEDEKEVFSFDQSVIAGRAVSVKGKSGWKLKLTPEKEKWLLEFTGEESWKKEIAKPDASNPDERKSIKLSDKLILRLN